MATSEPEPETSTSEPESEPESEPTTMEMVMPTVLILALGVIVCIILYCVSHRRRLSTLFSSTKRVKDIQIVKEVSVIQNKNYTFLTSRDLYALQRLETFQNNFCGLVKICIAPGVSLISCPLTLMLYQPLVDYCWPKASFPSPPNINDAIGCFLVPAGMVYAFMFGFAFQHVYQRHSQIGDIIQEKAWVLKELSWIIKNVNGISPATMLEILSILKSQLIDELCLVQGIDDQIGADPWSILSLVNKKVTDNTNKLSGLDGSRKIRRSLETEHRTESLMDLALYNELIRCLRTLRSLTDSGQSNTGMPFFHWFVLEMLSYFCFLGVLLISAQSYQIQLAMCVVTVTSISLLCYAVSDLDSPFHGFLRIDLGIISDMVMELQLQAHQLQVTGFEK